METQITRWRRRLIERDAFNREDVEELEEHLRCVVAELRSAGLSEEEAFMVAAHRVGTPGELSEEFVKVNSSPLVARRLIWMILGYFAISIVFTGIGLFGNMVSLSGVLRLNPTTGAWLGVALEGIVIGALVTALWAGWDRFCAAFAVSWHRLRSLRSGRPLGVLVAGLLFLVLSPLLLQASHILLARAYSPRDMGEYYLIAAMFTQVKALVFPVLLGVLLIRLNRTFRFPGASGAAS